jgi:hypothetical protein
MVKPGMIGSRIYQISKRQLLEPSQTLERRRVDNLLFVRLSVYEAVNWIPDF